MPIHSLTIDVPGDPLPKGSARAFIINGRARVTTSTHGLKDWENRVALQAAGEAKGIQFYGPVVLRVQFFLTRPKSVREPHHIKQPDLDKLTRAIGDALMSVLYEDDKQIVELHARKDYCIPPQLPGVRITLRGEIEPPVRRTMLRPVSPNRSLNFE